MTLYLRGKRYYFKKMIGGKVYYRKLDLSKGQEYVLSQRLKQVEMEILSQHYGLDYQPERYVALHDFIQTYLKAKAHKKSLVRDRQRLEIILDVWRNIPIDTVNKQHIEKLERHLFSKELKPATVNRYFEIIRGMFNLAIEEGIMRDNPARFYTPYIEDGQRRALSTEEIRKVLQASKKVSDDPRSCIQERIYDLILFALNTGLRLSEILNLQRSYIQKIQDSDVLIYPITATKSRRRSFGQKQKTKAVYLNTKAKEIIDRQPPSRDYVFQLSSRHPNVIRRSMARIRKLSGIEDFTFHYLRHTVSTIVSGTSDLATARVILGHADLKTTLGYTHPDLARQQAGMDKLGSIVANLETGETQE